MKKVNLKKLAAAGLAGGLLIAHANAQADGYQQRMNQPYYSNAMNDSSMQNTSGMMMSENELMSQLNAEGKAAYQALDSEGKKMALKLASQSCKGQNECKGMNSCKSTQNTCAGLGGCKGTSKGPFTNKNMAVMVAMKKMAEKRLQTMSGGGYSY